ncbi:hypothetical protein BJY24_000875 [Nocardia transvalensis]|uniref:Uncharacterized protein n=1 Tax=Nocardia transvalensis TaxID=37333 RepID=A0A7W9PA56_9NOCA|nr:hypothetical protein [Nocardia transvalensis]
MLPVPRTGIAEAMVDRSDLARVGPICCEPVDSAHPGTQGWTFRTTCHYYFSDSPRRWLGIFMFPDPDDIPSRIGEHPVGFLVSVPVPSDLLVPKLAVTARGAIMLRASVPIAAVTEDGDFRANEYDIGTSSQLRQRPRIHPIPQPMCADSRPQR